MNQDISNELKQQKVRKNMEVLLFLNESMEDYLYLIECSTGKIHFSSAIYEKFALPADDGTGYTLDDWLKIIYARDLPPVRKDLSQLISGEKKSHNMEYRIFDHNQNKIWVSCRGTVYYDDDGQPIMVMGRVSDKVLSEKVDSLTGLLNNRQYVAEVSASVNEGKSGCLLAVGLDNFKDINIKYGRAYGNQVLRLVAEALDAVVDSAVFLYRLDGDRFAVNLVGQNEKKAKELYQKMQKRVAPYCTLSAGAVRYDGNMQIDGETLYQYAESALDRAKKQGKNKLVFFSSDDYEERRSAIELQMEMRQSIQNGFQGFFLCYQPQLDCRTYDIYGAEALLRYRSPTRGIVGPDEFIPLLEQNGLICQVGQWVLETALKMCGLWRESIPNLHISVNISYIQLREKTITETVLAALDKSGLPGEALTLELTESMQLQDYQYFNRIFYQWEKAGIRIAIDDFGTGYSSLSYLKSIEISEIKIDRCFIRGIQHSVYNYKLLSNAIELARSTQIRVCCEGVETEEELLAIKELVPDTLQGYLFAMPYPKDRFEDVYVNQESDSYRKRIELEKYYRNLECRRKDFSASAAESEELSSIVESMDEMVYVCDIENFELYYLNSAGRRLTGIYDYKGRKCYEVVCGRTSPCEFCTASHLSKDKFCIRETENGYLKRHFIRKEKMIPWRRKMARLEMAIDITEKEAVDRIEMTDKGYRLLDCCKEDILSKAMLGLWVIRIHEDQEENEMFADSIMLKVMGISEPVSPVECYRHWYSRISEGYYHYVNAGVESMIKEGRTVQVEYTWNHPQLGEVVVRCLGMRVKDSEGMICVEGYHRIISNIDKPKFMTDTTSRTIFEYNERRQSIYFHNGRELLGITDDRVENFPQCWIDNQTVHPDFAEEFIAIFTHVQEKAELNGIEVLLRNKYGSYEWFKIRTRYLGRDRQDMHTIIVMLDPAGQDRLTEMEFMRKRDFYEAMLSETISYAEIDVETGQPQTAGGLWRPYEQECRLRGETFPQVVNRHIGEMVAPEDVERCRRYFDDTSMQMMYLAGTHTQKHSFRWFIDGELHWVEMVVHVFQERFTKNTYALLYLKDIDTQKKRELAQESAANTDPLTSVYNRRMFECKVKRFIQRENGMHTGTLILFDIDNFKTINDRYGHMEGDASLLRMTEILKSTFRSRDIVGRLGGDEFLVFIKDITDRTVLDRRLEQLFQSLKYTDGIPITCSAGITFVRKENFSYKESLREADLALYRSKQLGKNRTYYYEDMKKENEERP